MERFLTRQWELFIPGVRWLYVRSPANRRSASKTQVSTPVRGGFDPGDHRFRPQDIGVLKVWIYNPGMGTYPPRGALALRTIPSISAIGQCAGAWLSTPCGAVSTRGICVFVPRLSEF